MTDRIFRLLLTSCLYFFSCSVFSQEWISLGGNAKGEIIKMDVLENNESTYKVHFSVNGLYDNIICNKYGSFHSLSFGSNGYLVKEGEPALPLITRLIAIPPGTSPSVSIRNEIWEEVTIGTLYPAQKSLYGDTLNTEFILDDSVYMEPFIPSVLRPGKEMNWRGIRNIRIQVCPFRYYPQNNRLLVLKDFILDVIFQEQDSSLTKRKVLCNAHKHLGIFDNRVYYNQVLPESKANRSANDYDYLIIVKDDSVYNSQELLQFRRWKTFMGFKSKVIRINDNVSSVIKDSIATEYHNNHIKYVLLIGDVAPKDLNYVSDGVTKWYPSDYWYGCIDGNDAEQEIPVGRFPVNSLAQLSNMTNKTIRYETWKNLDYKALMVAHKPIGDFGYNYSFESCSDTIVNRSYAESLPFITAYGSSTASTNAYVNGIIDQGAHIVNYRGHAAVDCWGPKWNTYNQNYSLSSIDSIQQNTNAVVFSIACNSGNIYNDCMLDAFTCSSNGAVAYLGSSRTSDHGVNDDYNKLMFRNLLDSTVYRIGDLNMKTFLDLTNGSLYLPYIEENAYSYIIGGDPSLELWTAEPRTFSQVSITGIDEDIKVHSGNVNGYDVFISSLNGEFVDSVHVSGKERTFSMPSMEKFYISIKKHNYIPFIVYCDTEANHLQNVEVDYNGFYSKTPFAMGEYVDYDDTIGEVVVKSGSKLMINLGNEGVLMDGGTYIEKGASLLIK